MLVTSAACPPAPWAQTRAVHPSSKAELASATETLTDGQAGHTVPQDFSPHPQCLWLPVTTTPSQRARGSMLARRRRRKMENKLAASASVKDGKKIGRQDTHGNRSAIATIMPGSRRRRRRTLGERLEFLRFRLNVPSSHISLFESFGILPDPLVVALIGIERSRNRTEEC